jgi:hypothetical protein
MAIMCCFVGSKNDPCLHRVVAIPSRFILIQSSVSIAITKTALFVTSRDCDVTVLVVFEPQAREIIVDRTIFFTVVCVLPLTRPACGCCGCCRYGRCR